MDLPRGEPLLLLVLAGDLCLHHAHRFLGWMSWVPPTLVEGPLSLRLAAAALALLVPSLLYVLCHLLFSAQRLQRTLYGLLPLIWALLLARHLPLGMAEAGQLLPVSLSLWQPDWAAVVPAWQADSHVIAFCQSAVVLLGWGASVVLLRRQLATRRAAWLGASVLALALALAGRWLVAV
jgi:hypothetical protein